MRLPIRQMSRWLVLAGCVAGLSAADENKPLGAWDVRLIIDSTPGYDIREDASTSTATTTYVWRDMDGGRSIQPEVEFLRAKPIHGEDGSTLLFGARLSGGSQTNMPATIYSNGVTYANTGHLTLSYNRLAAGVVVGWQTAPIHIEDIQILGEFSAYGELGTMRITRQDDSGSGSDWGHTSEYGLRAGLYLGERSCYGGFIMSLLEGWGEGEVESFGGTATSKVHLHRDGLAVGAVAGIRF